MVVLASAVKGGGSTRIRCSPIVRNRPLKFSCFSSENQDHCQMPGKSGFMGGFQTTGWGAGALEGCDGIFDRLRYFRENTGFTRQIDDVVLRHCDEFPIRPFCERDQKHAVRRRDGNHHLHLVIYALDHLQKFLLSLFNLIHSVATFSLLAWQVARFPASTRDHWAVDSFPLLTSCCFPAPTTSQLPRQSHPHRPAPYCRPAASG